MTIPAPNLDDRAFQDLVDEAKRLVMRSCPEWTDNNVADPGVTLIEAFAYMTDQLIFRLNQVPDLHYVKFLELLGETLRPPEDAIAELMLWLTVPQPDDLVVPAGTMVSTARKGTEQPVTFTTLEDLAIVSVHMSGLLTHHAGQQIESEWEVLESSTEVRCFSDEPSVGDELYFGLSKAAPSCIVRLTIDARIEGLGVDPLRPPLVVEAWDGQAWYRVQVLSDSTGGLNRKGVVDVQLGSHVESSLAGVKAGWIRVRIVEAVGDQPAYTATPRIASITADALGGVVDAGNSVPVYSETLGRADGTPGESFQLKRFPLSAGQNSLRIEMSTPDGWQVWNQVETFAQSTPTDRHFTVDAVSGTVRFGPLLRLQDGSTRLYGATPEAGATLRIPFYRVGGGRQGNVGPRTITVLRTAIPFITRVVNPDAAVGGIDAETIDDLKARAAVSVRSRNRAVSALDFVSLVKQAAPSLVRAHCIDAAQLGKPGTVLVLVVPEVPSGIVPFELLAPRAEVLESVRDFIDQRRLVGTTVRIEPPKYLGVSVMARVALTPGAVKDTVTSECNDAIARFLHPIQGGYDGDGWPLGRSLSVGDIFGVLQHVDGVQYIETVRLVPVDAISGTRSMPTDKVQPGTLDLLYNVSNEIEFVDAT